jgi:23S rRNA U2552 (ribose-2'-O)-methylase RlmE/FtsJ
MIYFLLPKIHFNIYSKINCVESKELPLPCISNSLSYYLCDIKEKINLYEKEWDNYKKYTNPYEYIHTPVPYKKKCISKYKPLSRSYFKMLEISQSFGLHIYYHAIKTFHLAEGPGGFIEAICKLRNNKEDSYIGMTILDDDDNNIPSWKKSEIFLNENKNVFIETGFDKTGDILKIENFEYCVSKYGSSMDLITGDGGFDFSTNFNNQEQDMTKLLFAQVCFALCMQKREGSFVLKIFDSFISSTIDIIYILCSFYKKVYITKPQTSRYANSEKYIVCKGFLFENNSNFYGYIHNAFKLMTNTTTTTNITRFLSIPISHFFITRLEEYNSIFGQQQIENIYYTLTLIENKNKNDKSEKIDNIVKMNTQKCIQWCIKHNISYYDVYNYLEMVSPPPGLDI